MTTDGFAELLADRLVKVDVDRRLRWHDDPVAFANECIVWPAGKSLAPYQATEMRELVEHGRAAVRAPHGAGKTTTKALVALWFAITRDAAGIDWKVVTTAGAWRQLDKFLWPEIRLWAARLRWDAIGRAPFDRRNELLALTLKLEHGQAFAAASDDPALLEGAHAESVLIVLDEAKAIPVAVFDALEGAMSGTGEVLALASSTPGAPVGRFYDICTRKPGLEDWATLHVTLADAIEAGRVSADWASKRAIQWGETSAIYANRVLGEFASSDEDSVIPLSWVEAAVERWHAWRDDGSPLPTANLVVGVDVARSGADDTVLAMRMGDVVLELERHSREDTMTTTGRVVARLGHPSHQAVVGVIGIGAGVVDRLREQKHRVVGFHASERPLGRDRSGEVGFVNRRAEAWWKMRELLDPTYDSQVCLPDDDLLIGDLCAPRWSVTSTGKIQIEGKDDIKRRLGRSSDAGDAVVMAFTAPRMGGDGGSAAAVPYRDNFDPSVPWAAMPYGSVLPSEWMPGALDESRYDGTWHGSRVR